MKCCINCFNLEYFRERLTEDGETGDCEFCDSKGVPTIEARDLYPDFEGVLSLYEPTEPGEHYIPALETEAMDVGETLPDAIQQDWGIDVFNPDFDSDTQCRLLDAIRRGGEHYDYKMPPTPSSELWTSTDRNLLHVSEDELWYEFCNHIKHTRRFILDDTDLLGGPIADPKEWLPDLLRHHTETITTDRPLYRARVHDTRAPLKPFPASEMCAPPIEKCVTGRINPAGIRVLYAALERDTAVSEVRPEKGAKVTIATLKLLKPLKCADLKAFARVPHPFGHAPDDIAYLIRRAAFLHCVNDALSVPVRAQDADIDYVPTQYIAEVIKDAGYDGVLYRSSLRNGGCNMVIFDPDAADVNSNTELVEVTDVSVTFKPMPP